MKTALPAITRGQHCRILVQQYHPSAKKNNSRLSEFESNGPVRYVYAPSNGVENSNYSHTS